jgi:hypothetical protein
MVGPNYYHLIGWNPKPMKFDSPPMKFDSPGSWATQTQMWNKPALSSVLTLAANGPQTIGRCWTLPVLPNPSFGHQAAGRRASHLFLPLRRPMGNWRMFWMKEVKSPYVVFESFWGLKFLTIIWAPSFTPFSLGDTHLTTEAFKMVKTGCEIQARDLEQQGDHGRKDLGVMGNVRYINVF